MDTGEVVKPFKCDLCNKCYARDDLLARHRRSCQPNKITSKRKACSACVKAKSKCCYSQPTCSRCQKRSLLCEYLKIPKSGQSSGRSSPPDYSMDSDMSDASSFMSFSSTTGAATSLADPTANDPLWNFQWTMPTLNSWTSDPTFDTPTQAKDFTLLPHDSTNTSATGSPLQSSAASISAASSYQNTPSSWQMMSLATTPSNGSSNQSSERSSVNPVATTTGSSIPSAGPTAPMMTFPSPVPGLSMYPDTSSNEHPSLPTLLATIQSYPERLVSDAYQSPFVHRELYYRGSSDMTTMPKSAMAICCASGLKTKGDASFVRRVIAAERHRLVEAFHKYTYIEEWDALHAAWLYELMELFEPQTERTDQWQPCPRVKGLHRPLLLKMTRRFVHSHPEVTTPSPPLSPTTSLNYGATPSAWLSWYVAETARRTIFLANLVNFLASLDTVSGEQSPYYEPLDDELILSMQLPSSERTWSARSEGEWREAVSGDEVGFWLRDNGGGGSSASGSVSSASGGNVGSGTGLPTKGMTLRELLHGNSKEQLRVRFQSCFGVEGSDDVRGLIALCAAIQFG
ncbi:hypothetical protein K402DRAFT_402874 [Aulographum hederae CBS 113979]|uniref:Zn(2)-C6 fungal-type domain-containing protein n=1 Tax=Aulographum hederae CBS 113979 TaxID=1176131 RepID=A0A6G1H572_9PEZI|nr:hypothetical protein K402DRAFT_402874 [Aulographum hederae CBS 113979]